MLWRCGQTSRNICHVILHHPISNWCAKMRAFCNWLVIRCPSRRWLQQIALLRWPSHLSMPFELPRYRIFVMFRTNPEWVITNKKNTRTGNSWETARDLLNMSNMGYIRLQVHRLDLQSPLVFHLCTNGLWMLQRNYPAHGCWFRILASVFLM